MDEILHANIFFFITGIAVIVFSALLCVALYHGIKVLTSLRRILSRIEEGTEVIAEDLGQMRAYFSEDGFIKRLFKTIFGGTSRVVDEERPRSARRPQRKRTELEIKDEK